MKKILLITAFILLLIAIPLTVFLVKQQQDIRQRATPATTLYFDPATITKNVDNTFSVNIMINTGANLVSATELHLTFDPTYLEAVSIQNGTFLDSVLVSGTVGAGTASITVGTNTSKTGTGIVSILTLKTLKTTSTPAQVQFDTATKVVGVGEGTTNVLVGSQPVAITITGTTLQASASSSPALSNLSTGASPTPTPSSSPSPQPTTKITSPVDNTTVAIKRPAVSGVSFSGALIILSINTTPIISANFYANSSGAWTYTPTTDLANGSYTVTITGDNNAGKTEVTTAHFIVSTGGVGGIALASSSPSSSSSATPKASASSATSSAVPVTGTTTPTLFILGSGLLLLLFGAGSFLL